MSKIPEFSWFSWIFLSVSLKIRQQKLGLYSSSLTFFKKRKIITDYFYNYQNLEFFFNFFSIFCPQVLPGGVLRWRQCVAWHFLNNEEQGGRKGVRDYWNFFLKTKFINSTVTFRNGTQNRTVRTQKFIKWQLRSEDEHRIAPSENISGCGAIWKTKAEHFIFELEHK